ncbi:MAG: mechanosensitive ion channel family protein [Candidatus Caldarchaeum sp.]
MNFLEMMDLTVFLTRLAVVAGILLVVFIIVRLLGTILRRTLKAAPPLAVDQTIHWISISVWLVGILLAVNQLGLNLDILLLLMALAGIAVVVASRDLLTSFVSRYFLGTYIPVKKGDDVEVAGFRGKVIEINHVATVLLSGDGSVITVPNSMFIKRVFTNRTSLASQRITIPVLVPAKLSLPKTEAEVLKAAYKYKAHLDQRFPPIFSVKSRGSSQVEAELDVLVAKPEMRDVLAVELASKVREVLEKLASQDGK